MDRNTQVLPTGGSCEDEVERYLINSDMSLQSLRRYPNLLKGFIKYNSSVPSSAAVERLFNSAGQILVPRRCKVSDDVFYKLVFLRYKLKKYE